MGWNDRALDDPNSYEEYEDQLRSLDPDKADFEAPFDYGPLAQR